MMPPVIAIVKVPLIATIEQLIAIYETMLMKLQGCTTRKVCLRFKEFALKVYMVFIKRINHL
ncbi:hypothetical protein ASU64_20975 [Enterobacter hormaechei subsp. hoffmannii]|nr:hypothetical protein ASU64_20975 [Enterobacter hormaechei subsp. hoffmannii]